MDLRKYYGFENNPDKFNQYTARNAMTKIYRNYYAHWVDYDIMLSVSALIGLAFAMESYDRSFNHFHYPVTSDVTPLPLILNNFINLLLTLFALTCAIFRQHMRSYWGNITSP